MVFGGTRRRGLNNTSMSEDGSLFQARGRKARREGGGNQDNPRDEKSIRSVHEYDEQSIRSVFEHDEAPSKGRGSDAVVRSTLSKFAERRHLDAERESTPFSARSVLGRT